MRSGPSVFMACCAAAALAFAAVGLMESRDEAFKLGVRPFETAVVMDERETACQRRILVQASFDRVEFRAATFFKPGPALGFGVMDSSSGDVLEAASIRGGYGDNAVVSVRTSIGEGRRIDVCVRNEGRVPLALYGGPSSQSASTLATLDGKTLGHDLHFRFMRDDARSLLSLAPETFERATIWRPLGLGPWALWLLAGAILLLVPPLLHKALRGTA